MVLLVCFKDSLVSIEERVGALPWTLFSDKTLEERIVLVSIDERSINKLGPWPWSREIMGQLVSSINAAGAQLQIHDVLYPVGARPGDAEFAEALLFDRSVVAYLPIIGRQDPPIRSGA